MAHFAQLDATGTVFEVLVVDNASIDNLPFPESEPVGIAYLNSFLPPAVWKQTSYNNNFRKRYAGIGYTYMEQYDVFVPPKEYPYFIFDTTKMEWVPPVPYPTDGGGYVWDDTTRAWILARAPFTVIGE
jgi:hypothetical protein